MPGTALFWASGLGYEGAPSPCLVSSECEGAEPEGCQKRVVRNRPFKQTKLWFSGPPKLFHQARGNPTQKTGGRARGANFVGALSCLQGLSWRVERVVCTTRERENSESRERRDLRY